LELNSANSVLISEVGGLLKKGGFSGVVFRRPPFFSA